MIERDFSGFSYQICIIQCVTCQLVASKAARFWECWVWVFLPHFYYLFFLVDKTSGHNCKKVLQIMPLCRFCSNILVHSNRAGYKYCFYWLADKLFIGR